jgi:hypothetical protein
MRHAATGTFNVQLTPREADHPKDATPGRLSIEKRYTGDLVGTGTGEMLTAGTNVKGSAGYVAIELVQGSLKGKSGSFILQHSGTMRRGTGELTVAVVPDSGTAELAGI